MKIQEYLDENFSVDAIIAWVKQLPSTREFDYTSNSHCFFASFLKEHLKLSGVSVSGFDNFSLNNQSFKFSSEVERFRQKVILPSLGWLFLFKIENVIEKAKEVYPEKWRAS